MTLRELTEIIREYERRIAPGSETELWGHYCEDIRNRYGVPPYHDGTDDVEVPEELVKYWIDRYDRYAYWLSRMEGI